MKARHVRQSALDALSDTPVVFVQGPRQAGKTTLVRDLVAEGKPRAYHTLDRAAQRAAAESDPDGFIDALPRYVILDEVQRAPAIFTAIKRSVDDDRAAGRFLLTGSANALVLPKVSDSLAGRMEVVTLRPFSQGEIEGEREGFVDACFAKDFAPPEVRDSDWPSLAKRIARGGFPEVASRRDASRREAWFKSYVTTILERDVADLANVQNLRELPHVLRLIAARSSGTLNLSDLARDARMSLTTLQRHWALLEAIFFVQTLPAWNSNLTSRMTKAPKIVLSDTGLLCHLLHLDEDRLIADDLMTGAALETFVACEIQKQVSWSATRPGIYHFRTHKQQEVDLVLEDSRGRIVGIEVKRTASPSSGDFAGLRHLRDVIGKRFVRGVLLCTSHASVGFAPDLFAVPVGALWRMKA